MKDMSGNTREYLENCIHSLRSTLNQYPGSGMEDEDRVFTSTEDFILEFEQSLSQLRTDWEIWKKS